METTPYRELGKGTLWVLKEFDRVSVRDIANLTGWKSKSVRDELRRIIDNSGLGLYVHKEKDEKGNVTFSMDELAKRQEFDFLCDFGRRSYRFNTLVLER